MGAHAVRSASGAKRWMNCPGSLRMEEDRPKTTTTAARLGTAAHALCEVCLKTKTDAWQWQGGYVRLDDREDATVHRPPATDDDYNLFDYMTIPANLEDGDAPIEQGHEDFPIDDAMVYGVQVYLDEVRAELARLGPMAELSVERRFSLNWLVGFDWDERLEELARQSGQEYVSPNGIWLNRLDGKLYHADGRRCWGPMFGTNDASVWLPFDHVTVFDYKNGFILVEVEESEQLSDYALGIAREIEWAFETLDLVIVQPNGRHADGPVRRWSTTKAYLRGFERRLRDGANATEQPDAPIRAGSWCQWCRASPVCRAFREETYRQAEVDFGDGYEEPTASVADAETSDEDLAQRMRVIPLLDMFIKSTETEVLRRLRESPTGEAPFGKLVRKRSKRRFREDLTETVLDPQTGEDVEVPVTAFELLERKGIPRELMFEEPKPKTPAKIEALRPPELMASLKANKVKAPAAYIKAMVAEVSFKPEGGITVAPVDDPRPPVDPSAAAMSDFKTYEEDSDDE
jgi:hypothetical protein